MAINICIQMQLQTALCYMVCCVMLCYVAVIPVP